MLRRRTHVALTNAITGYVIVGYAQSRANSHRIQGLMTSKGLTNEQINADVIEDRHLIN